MKAFNKKHKPKHTTKFKWSKEQFGIYGKSIKTKATSNKKHILKIQRYTYSSKLITSIK
jgi:hypothetical protein